MVDRKPAARGRDPLPPPRRLLGQRHGGLEGPGDRIIDAGARMAAVRGISHCYQRPTYPDWPYSVFTMAHGRSKEECDAILDRIADEHDLAADRAVLYSSTEFKKIRLHYFTDDYAAWEADKLIGRLRGVPRSSTSGRCGFSPAGSTPRFGRWDRSGATRSSSSAARAPRSGTPTATATSTGSAPGAADPRARPPRVVEAVGEAAAPRHQLRRPDRGRGAARGRGRRPLRLGRDGADGLTRGPRPR